jgi:chemotaxis family two-component system response regulator Rcp1
MDMKTDRDIEILLVEDNPGDVRLTLEALKEGRINNKVNVVTDGEQAINYLKKGLAAHTLPDLILLDLNLPKLSGREVLEIVKTDEGLKHIPVIILTTSKSEDDILKSYQHYANCYITKPVDFEQFSVAIKKLEDFWFSIVKIPHKTEQ